MHMHLNFDIKWALHFSTLAIKLFNSDTKLLKLLTQHHKPGINASRPVRHTAFKTNALRLGTNEGQLKRLLLQYKWLKQPYLSLVWL